MIDCAPRPLRRSVVHLFVAAIGGRVYRRTVVLR